LAEPQLAIFLLGQSGPMPSGRGCSFNGLCRRGPFSVFGGRELGFGFLGLSGVTTFPRRPPPGWKYLRFSWRDAIFPPPSGNARPRRGGSDLSPTSPWGDGLPYLSSGEKLIAHDDFLVSLRVYALFFFFSPPFREVVFFLRSLLHTLLSPPIRGPCVGPLPPFVVRGMKNPSSFSLSVGLPYVKGPPTPRDD